MFILQTSSMVRGFTIRKICQRKHIYKMDIVDCKIIFDKRNAAFYPEEKITGQVIIDNPSNIKMESIILTLSGECVTDSAKINYFCESYSSNHCDAYGTPMTYNEKRIFSVEKILYDILDGTNLFMTRNAFPFDHILMADLPTTVKAFDFAKTATVQYRAKVEIHFAEEIYIAPRQFEKDFLVHSKLDLNQIPFDVSEPFFYEEEKEYRIVFGKNAPVHVKIESPMKGYVPGQNMPISLTVNNKSNFSLTVELAFKSCIIVNVKGETSCIKKTIHKFFKNISIEAKRSIIMQTNFTVPNIPPSYSNLSVSNVSTSYVFEVKAVASRLLKLWLQNWSELQFTSNEIFIGSIPLQNDCFSDDTASSAVESDSMEIAKEALYQLTYLL